ncbi:transposase [Catenulispora sp. MAP12-49]|uniref:winged helix-turn-helix domain-containing protein n=1 Tax=Catenulispora sp. MAP12-49 TaxID=3156302 RepID=UPI00351537D2
MRYGRGGGLDAAERARREEVRFQAAEYIEAGLSDADIAKQLQVTDRSVARWRAAFTGGGYDALLSKGAAGRPLLLTAEQQRELAAALKLGPAEHGWSDDQRWTLVRIRDLIWKLFGVRYKSLSTVWELMKRIRFSWQVPTRRAAERNEELILAWREEQWPDIKARPRPSTPGSALKTKQDKA